MVYVLVKGKHVNRNPLEAKKFVGLLIVCSSVVLSAVISGPLATAEEELIPDLFHSEEPLDQQILDDFLYRERWNTLLKLGIVSNNQTINAFDGVYDYNGKTEKFYSSLKLVHKDINLFWCDHDGFWHDADGYYVVATIDHDSGDVFRVSKGLAKALDCGCDPGVVDFYTNWE